MVTEASSSKPKQKKKAASKSAMGRYDKKTPNYSEQLLKVANAEKERAAAASGLVATTSSVMIPDDHIPLLRKVGKGIAVSGEACKESSKEHGKAAKDSLKLALEIAEVKKDAALNKTTYAQPVAKSGLLKCHAPPHDNQRKKTRTEDLTLQTSALIPTQGVTKPPRDYNFSFDFLAGPTHISKKVDACTDLFKKIDISEASFPRAEKTAMQVAYKNWCKAMIEEVYAGNFFAKVCEDWVRDGRSSVTEELQKKNKELVAGCKIMQARINDLEKSDGALTEERNELWG